MKFLPSHNAISILINVNADILDIFILQKILKTLLLLNHLRILRDHPINLAQLLSNLVILSRSIRLDSGAEIYHVNGLSEFEIVIVGHLVGY